VLQSWFFYSSRLVCPILNIMFMFSHLSTTTLLWQLSHSFDGERQR
jgi:hypothetical protein